MDYSNLGNATKLKVVGVGGAGKNAVNNMIEAGITGVEFIVINTDKQDLDNSKTDIKVLIGRGTGAGAVPEKGRIAAKESEDRIKEVLKDTDMLFITAGMGGGTGTGASPVVAEIAREMGILTVAIVTKPFNFEGPSKAKNAVEGIENLKKHVDTLVVIPNEKLFDLPKHANQKLRLLEAFKEADSVLRIGVQGITDLITKQGYINLDLEDIKTTTQNAGIAVLGFGEAEGADKAKVAIKQALNSPLLEKSIEGARKMLVNIAVGQDFELDEIREAANIIYERVQNPELFLIWGVFLDEQLEDKIRISLIATDFDEEIEKRAANKPAMTEETTESEDEEGKLITEQEIKKTYVVPPFFTED